MKSGSAGQIWGLVSDVHGNAPALEEALRVLAAAGARRLAFLGDYLGRGDNERCVRRIREVADLALVGNRDLDWQDRVAPPIRTWIGTLARSAAVGPLLLAHGDARLTPALSTSQITRGFMRAWDEMQRADASVWAFGHSHHARVWRKASAAEPAQPLGLGETDLLPGYRYFVNVGTTGLPFPNKGGPSVALIDLIDARIHYLPLDVDRIRSG